MSRNHSLGFSSTANTMRIDSPDIGGAPRRPSSSQRMQFILRVTATLFALLTMSLFAASVSLTNRNFTNILGNGDWTDGLALAPSLLSLIINSILLLRYKMGPSSSTPAIRAVVDFLIWGLAIPSVVYAVAGGMFWSWSSAVPEANGTIDCTFWYNGMSPECAPVAYEIGRIQMAGAVFLSLLCLLHMALCVAGVSELVTKKEQRQSVMQPGFEMTTSGKDVESRFESRPVTSA